MEKYIVEGVYGEAMKDNELTLTGEVERIFARLVVFREESNRSFDEDEEARYLLPKVWRIVSFCLTLLGVALIPVGQYFAFNIWVLIVFMLMVVIGCVGMSFSLFADFKGMLEDGVVDFFKSCERDAHLDVELYESFYDFSVESLQIALNRLTVSTTSLQSTIDVLVGGFTKVGILPAVIAILIALSKLDSEYFLNFYFVSIIVTGIYLVCFKFSQTRVFLTKYISYIDFHLKHRRE